MFQKFLIKLNRLSAWALLFCMLAYGISGYGMTKGIIDYNLASKLHLYILGPITLLAFVVHTAWAIHLALIRWGIWNKITKVLLFIVYLIIITTFVYFDVFISLATSFNSSNNQNQSTTGSITEKTFTIAELVQYDGLNGQPAYVAVEGVVYDLSSVFNNGIHKGHLAGKDLTKDFDSIHSRSILQKFPIVGILK